MSDGERDADGRPAKIQSEEDVIRLFGAGSAIHDWYRWEFVLTEEQRRGIMQASAERVAAIIERERREGR
jgi:hypothetical protein